MTANVHLICGLTGAGKSTYADALRRTLSGVRFSIDEWNSRLFFPDRSPTADFDWYYERVQRSCAQMRATAEQVLETGAPVIFDCGFTNRGERGIFYDWASEHSYATKLHFLDVASETRWRRVEQRNTERGETFMLEVAREMFDFMETIWEAPGADELARHSGEHVTN